MNFFMPCSFEFNHLLWRTSRQAVGVMAKTYFINCIKLTHLCSVLMIFQNEMETPEHARVRILPASWNSCSCNGSCEALSCGCGSGRLLQTLDSSQWPRPPQPATRTSIVLAVLVQCIPFVNVTDVQSWLLPETSSCSCNSQRCNPWKWTHHVQIITTEHVKTLLPIKPVSKGLFALVYIFFKSSGREEDKRFRLKCFNVIVFVWRNVCLQRRVIFEAKEMPSSYFL